MAKLFGIIPYGGGSPVGEFVKDVGDVSSGFMSSAVQSAQTTDAREAAIADAVESSILKAKLNVDAKYPEFKKYEDQLDDKFINAEIDFFDLTYNRGQKRFNESKLIYEEVLDNPFDYQIDENFNAGNFTTAFLENFNYKKEEIV